MTTNPFSPLDWPARGLYEDFKGAGKTHEEAVKLAKRYSSLELPEDLYHAESWCQSDWRYPKGEGARIRHMLDENIGANMRKADVFPSKYLKADDIKGRGDIRVTIKYVEREKMQDGTEKAVMYMVNKEKGIVLNAGNWDVLEEAFGDSDDWGNQKIVLYTERTRKPDGSPTEGIRIKLPLPPQSATPARPANAWPVPTHEDYAPENMDDEIPF